MSRRLATVLCVPLMALLSSGAVLPGTDGGSEHPFTPGARLTIDLQAGGSATITGVEGTVARVSVTGADSKDDAEAIRVRADDGGLEITSGFGLRGRGGDHVDLSIEVPHECDVEFESMGGDLTLIDLRGEFEGRTMGGALRLRKVQGTAHLTTMGGEVEARECDLDGKLSTMGGEVLFEDVTGSVEGTSMGGSVRYVNVRDKDGNPRAQNGLGVPGMSGKTVTMSTMGGDIEVAEAPAGASLSTMGGNIVVKNASEFVKAETMGGDIDITVQNGWLSASTMGGDIEATIRGSLGDGSKGISLSSMSGDVTVTIPGGLSMDLDLTIDYTRNSDQNYRITTPFDLKEERSAEWDSDHGTPRKTIHATGTVAGGRQPVRIKTINGNITIRQGR